MIVRNKTFNNHSYVPWNSLCRITDGNGIIIDDFRNTQNGSSLGNYAGKTLIEDNISWYNGGTGIHTFKSDQVDIINNTAYRNSQSKKLNEGQILAGFGDNIRIVNNILVSDFENIINSNYLNTRMVYANNLHYNLTSPRSMRVKLTNKTCINGKDPLFVKPARTLTSNFRLSNSSPGKKSGSDIMYSFSEYKRLKSPAADIDIGAYSF